MCRCDGLQNADGFEDLGLDRPSRLRVYTAVGKTWGKASFTGLGGEPTKETKKKWPEESSGIARFQL